MMDLKTTFKKNKRIMQENTVTISLEKYHELNDFMINIKKGKRHVISESNVLGFGRFWSSESYLTDDEIVEQFSEKNDELNKKIILLELELELEKEKELEKNDDVLNNTACPKPKLKDIKNVSWIEFFKYKFNR